MTISGHNIIIGQNKKIVNIVKIVKKFLITCTTLNKFVINFYKQ